MAKRVTALEALPPTPRTAVWGLEAQAKIFAAALTRLGIEKSTREQPHLPDEFDEALIKAEASEKIEEMKTVLVK